MNKTAKFESDMFNLKKERRYTFAELRKFTGAVSYTHLTLPTNREV